MGYPVKVQKVDRPTNTSFYVNFPAALAESAGIKKGEEMEWLVEDRNCFVLKRVQTKKSLLSKKMKRLA
jgi:bifunctional DNA-binding transcriptional regulator/antitoxin component of YhaV-PrlF toxin-antitoxin module